MRWVRHTLRSGINVRYKQNQFGVSILHRGFWLHVTKLDWDYVDDFFQKEFYSKTYVKEIVVVQEQDGYAMLGTRTRRN